jgi:hypothetical protein
MGLVDGAAPAWFCYRCVLLFGDGLMASTQVPMRLPGHSWRNTGKRSAGLRSRDLPSLFTADERERLRTKYKLTLDHATDSANDDRSLQVPFGGAWYFFYPANGRS